MRRGLRLTLILLVAAAAAMGTGARAGVHAAAARACPTLGGTQLTQDTSKSTISDGNPIVVCNGSVRTFDGTPLDVDVTLPTIQTATCAAPQTSCPPPLIMFLSGWSNDICQFESSSLEGDAVPGCSDFVGTHANGYHWNNAWAASNGMVALTYTPRGWYESCGKVASTGYSYASDSRCSDTPGEQSWVHLYDRRYEIHDAQYLAGLIVDAGLVDPKKIVTTGDSGGGGPSWDLALSQDQVATTDSTWTPTAKHIVTVPWTSPARGVAMHLAAALPMYTWTDLVDALLPNGTSSDGFNGAPPDGAHGYQQSPAGVEKLSYVAGLFALGVGDIPGQPDRGAQYAAPNQDPTADLVKWFGEIGAGEPAFSGNPDAQNILDQVGGPLRSSIAMPVPHGAAETPIFVIQGLTDPLFPATQALTMINRLKNASEGGDPNYPVYAFLGDIGHSYANNPSDVWQQAHNEGDAWLSEVLGGRTITQPPLTLDTTRCVSGQTLQTYAGAGPAAIATSTLTFKDAAGETLVHTPVSPPTATYEGSQTDPIAHGGCRSMSASQSDPLRRSRIAVAHRNRRTCSGSARRTSSIR